MILKRKEHAVWVNAAEEKVLDWRMHYVFGIPEKAVKMEITSHAKKPMHGLHIKAQHGKLRILDRLEYKTSNALYKFIYDENQKGNYYFDRVILK